MILRLPLNLCPNTSVGPMEPISLLDGTTAFIPSYNQRFSRLERRVEEISILEPQFDAYLARNPTIEEHKETLFNLRRKAWMIEQDIIELDNRNIVVEVVCKVAEVIFYSLRFLVLLPFPEEMQERLGKNFLFFSGIGLIVFLVALTVFRRI